MKKYIAFISIVLVIFISWKLFNKASYIAVVGPMQTANGEAMVQGAQLYVDQINQQGGVNGKSVELLLFDDAIDVKKIAEQVVNSNAVAVIGHYDSKSSLAAAPIYQKYGIPMITGSATVDELTKNNDWAFRITFNNSSQGALLANYAFKNLKYQNASILFDEGVYGSTLATAFEQTAKQIDNLNIKYKWGFNKDNFHDVLKRVVQIFSGEGKEAGILFLATHSKEALEAIVALRQEWHYTPIIGADFLSSSQFNKQIKQLPQEQIQPGYFTDGIYLTTQFAMDIADELAIKFESDFVDRHQTKPSTTAALYYDTAKVALHALQKIPATKIKEQRRLLKNNLWKMSNSENSIKGVTGPIYFDKYGDVVKSIPISVYKKGEPEIALSQYRLLTNPRYLKGDILPKILDGQLIKIDENVMTKAQIVYVGMDMNEITNLNTQNSTFTADFYLWFRFKTESFADKEINFINAVNFNGLGKPIINEKYDTVKGIFTTRTYRVKTRFKGSFDFHNYPLDRQILPIQFRHQQKTRDILIYIVDHYGMRIDNIVDRYKKIFFVDGWQVSNVSFFEGVQENDSTFGLPYYFHSQQRMEYSLFNVTIEIKRNALNFIFKNLFPTFILIMLGYGIFFTTTLSIQLGLGVNIILPTSILHVRLASQLPNIAYFTLVEYFFYMSYLLALLCIGMGLTMHSYEKNEKFVRKLTLMGRVWYPVFVLICFTFVVFQYFANLR
ncbi:ABC transporter substrate-binding protein [Candidatus Halobeggiatoa sp. HSG11]|nr:ABC transporter substrate-binding protein [Candidatus Halobeggiatoa sp. HSG11]